MKVTIKSSSKYGHPPQKAYMYTMQPVVEAGASCYMFGIGFSSSYRYHQQCIVTLNKLTTRLICACQNWTITLSLPFSVSENMYNASTTIAAPSVL